MGWHINNFDYMTKKEDISDFDDMTKEKRERE
jgi:hypothetical protein